MSESLLSRLIVAGVPADIIADVARLEARAQMVEEALEAQRQTDEMRKGRVRDGNRTRQRLHRCHASSRVTGVTERDEALVTDAAPLDKKGPQTPKELNPQTPTNDADASSVPPAGVEPGKVDLGDEKPKPKARKRTVGSRIKADWQPPAVDDLPLEFQALARKWPAGAYEVVATVFRNHWLSEGRAIGAKRDWPKTWCNWLYRENAQVLRAAKQGVDFSTGRSAPISAAEAEQARLADAAVVALQQCEPGCAKLIREALREEAGERTYDAWLRPTLMGMDGDALVVSSSSQFMLDWVCTNYGDRIRCLAAQAEKRSVEIRWRVMRPPAKKSA